MSIVPELSKHSPILTREMAAKGDPGGEFCSFCGKLNDNWDDVGYYYITRSDGAYVAQCGCQGPNNTCER